MSASLILASCGVLAENTEARKDLQRLTVEELMRLDAQVALRQARKSPFVTDQDKNLSGSQVESGQESSESKAVPAVHAIYGIGRDLTAEVRIGSTVHFFQNRQKRSASIKSADYALEKIAPPCVHMQKENKPQVLCLQQEQP